MKKTDLISLVLMGILLTGCGKETQKPIKTKKNEVIEKTVNDIEIKKGIAFEKGTDKKYSGTVVEKYENGNIKVKTEYSEGIKNGAEENFYEDGMLSMKTSFINGKLEGTRVVYTKSVQSFSNGIIEDNKVYHANGNLNVDYAYVNGKLEGTLEYYHANGKPYMKVEYKNGMKDGVTEIYDLKGEIVKKEIYKENKLVENKE